jgi:thiol-disulfide isomerase/thioredoxin
MFIFGFNFFYRDSLTDYRLYGTEKNLISKNIIVSSIKVKTKNSVDTLLNLDSSIHLIDFWSLYCPGCYADMPFLDSIYLTSNNIKIISLLVPYRREPNKEFEKLRNLKNKYQSFYLNDSNLPKKLNIDGFPSYFILYNQKIIFRGRLENVVNKLKDIE